MEYVGRCGSCRILGINSITVAAGGQHWLVAWKRSIGECCEEGAPKHDHQSKRSNLRSAAAKLAWDREGATATALS